MKYSSSISNQTNVWSLERSVRLLVCSGEDLEGHRETNCDSGHEAQSSRGLRDCQLIGERVEESGSNEDPEVPERNGRARLDEDV